MNKGYIKTFRKLVEWEWYQEANTMRLFIHCLLMANYEEKKWKGIIIPIGSFITSSSNLAHQLRLTRAEIRHAICNLQTTSEIAIETTNRFTMITVRNWAEYQGLDFDEIANEKTNKDCDLQPSNNHNIRNKEVKNIKNKDIKDKTLPPQAVVEGEKTPKIRFGNFKNVLLTEEENKRLHVDYGNADELIEYLSYHIEMKGYKAKNHNLAIRKWVPNAVKEEALRQQRINGGSAFNKPSKPDIEVPWMDEYWKNLKNPEETKKPDITKEITEIEEYLTTIPQSTKQYVQVQNYLDKLRKEANQA